MRQLIFTSALSGLAGRSGFCTVARHASLRERVVTELEKMSEYEPPTGTRPTVFSFRVFSGGDETLYILSRLCDAGTDAFGRANHVAHHLIFGGNEISALPPPAEVALRFPVWCKKYSERAHFFEENQPLPPEILRKTGEKFVPAKRWEALTGDAGNAALLCPRGDPRATIFVGDDSMTETVLGLFAESAETVGAENAWEIAFSTGIYSEKNRGRFLWRMVSARELAVRYPGDFILDFLAPLGFLRAPQTDFAEYARTGTLPTPAGEGGARFRRKISLPTPPKISVSATVAGDASSAPESRATSATSVPEARSPSRLRKKIFDSAGTLKFLLIAVGLVLAVIVCVSVWGIFEDEKSVSPATVANVAGTVEPAQPAVSSGVPAFEEMFEERLAAGDVIGAAETWIAFSEAFPQAAEARKGTFVPRFKLKIVDAYATRLARRLRGATEFGGSLSGEERLLVAADLAMFRRVCRELELTPGRIAQKNLAIIEQAEKLSASHAENPHSPVPASETR